jgi:hypothetical protein
MDMYCYLKEKKIVYHCQNLCKNIKENPLRSEGRKQRKNRFFNIDQRGYFNENICQR